VEQILQLANLGHLLHLLPGLALGLVFGAIMHALPLHEKLLRLQVVEDRLAKGIDATQ
jgi:hypothetical protein